jgi:hypothetical protein
MKRAFLAFVVLAVAAVFMSVHASFGSAAAATPTPAALQYDEISRMIVPPATPPAPGTFQTDYQTIVSAGSPEDLMKSAGNPEELMARMSLGHVTRYAYYNGWIRTDDLVAQKATIEKCQQHQYIALDLAKKTYTIQNTQPACPTPQMPTYGHASSYQPQPGSADMTVSGTLRDLGPLTIDEIGTTGAEYGMQMQTTNATGSCRNGDFKMDQTRYVSQIRVPRAFCPLPRTMTSGGMISRGTGCDPRMHVSGTLSGLNDADRLVMYSRIGIGQGGVGAMVIERGNIKWLGGAAAESLFAIPPGFTQSE